MTPAEEDCIVNDYHPSIEGNPHYPVAEAIRLAIRAAVAHERERCAKVCEETVTAGRHQFDKHETPTDCAAAIRRGD